MKGMVFGYLDILHIYLTRYMEDGDGDGVEGSVSWVGFFISGTCFCELFFHNFSFFHLSREN